MDKFQAHLLLYLILLYAYFQIGLPHRQAFTLYIVVKILTPKQHKMDLPHLLEIVSLIIWLIIVKYFEKGHHDILRVLAVMLILTSSVNSMSNPFYFLLNLGVTGNLITSHFKNISG